MIFKPVSSAAQHLFPEDEVQISTHVTAFMRETNLRIVMPFNLAALEVEKMLYSQGDPKKGS